MTCQLETVIGLQCLESSLRDTNVYDCRLCLRQGDWATLVVALGC